MNRSLLNVILGGVGTKSKGTGKAKAIEGSAIETTSDQVLSMVRKIMNNKWLKVVEMLHEAKDIIIVPGYGLCAAQVMIIRLSHFHLSRTLNFDRAGRRNFINLDS